VVLVEVLVMVEVLVPVVLPVLVEVPVVLLVLVEVPVVLLVPVEVVVEDLDFPSKIEGRKKDSIRNGKILLQSNIKVCITIHILTIICITILISLTIFYITIPMIQQNRASVKIQT
jgi:hypothetical protein